MFNYLYLVFLPIGSFCLNADILADKITTPMRNGPLNEWFEILMDKDLHVHGISVSASQAVKIVADTIGGMQLDSDTQYLTNNVWIMKMLADLADALKEFEANAHGMTANALRYYKALLGNSTFRISTAAFLSLDAKAKFFGTLKVEHPQFASVFDRALNIANDFEDLKPFMSTTSKKVRTAYILMLRKMMTAWDKPSFTEIETKLNGLYKEFNDKDFEDLKTIGFNVVNRANLKPEEQKKLKQQMLAGQKA